MRKLTLVSLSAALLLFTGCGGSSQPKLPKEDRVSISYSKTIAYAYLKDGEELVEISTKRKEPGEDVEIVKITVDGFAPDYSIPNGKKACIYSVAADKEKQKREKDYKFCHSSFAVSTAGGKAIDLFTNALVTVSTVGLNAATGTVSRMMEFDREKFLEAVKKSDLPRYKKALLESEKMLESKKREFGELYRKLTFPYQQGASKVQVRYETVDRSGLMPKGFVIEQKARVVAKSPISKRIDYDRLFSFSATPAEFDSRLAELSANIRKVMEKELVEYKKELQKQYSEYELQVPKEVSQRYNDHILFHAVTEAPSVVPADMPESRVVTVRYIVDYADLTGLYPKSFRLEDENFAATFEPAGNDSIIAIGANKTKSFVTMKTLTLYYAGAVNSLTNLDVEIAPEAMTLRSNSVYPVVSSKQAELAGMKGATLKKLENRSVDYGYALKYRIEKTNLDKSIYKTEPFSLLEIYRSYL